MYSKLLSMISLHHYRYWDLGREFRAPCKSVNCELEIRSQKKVILFDISFDRWFNRSWSKALIPRECTVMLCQIGDEDKSDYVLQYGRNIAVGEMVQTNFFKELIQELNMSMTEQELFDFFCSIALNEVVVRYPDIKRAGSSRSAAPLTKSSKVLLFEAEFMKGKSR